MADNEEIKIIINADDRASGVLNSVGKSATSLGGVLKGVGVVAGAAVVAGFGAMVGIAVSSVKAFDEAQLASKQMEATLKSTGNAAGLFAEDLKDQAAALQRVTKFSDEAVMGAQNLLLTFTQIKGPIFQEATQTILDMSQALGQDLKSSSIQLGKALNDPINGITALSRVGVSFDDTQKKMIETMVNAGDVMGAQKVILAELNKEFGGSAVAAAQTFGGQMEILKNQVGELQETLGKAIVTAITPFITQLAEFAGREDVQETFQNIAIGIGNLIKGFFDLTGVVVGFGKTIYDFAAGVMETLKPTFEIIALIIQEQLVPLFQMLWDTLKNELWPAIQELWVSLQPFMPLLEQFAKLVGIAIVAAILAAVGAITIVLTAAAKLLTLFVELSTFMSKVVLAVWKELENRIISVVEGFKMIIEFAKKAADAVKNFSVSGAASSVAKSLGFRAEGGPVTSGSPYIVGERGPELFVPSRSGSIIPNSNLGNSVSGGGIQIFITGTFLSEDAAEQLGNKMIDRLKLQLRI